MKVTISGFLHHRDDGIGGESFCFFASDMTKYGYVVVSPYSIEAEVPDDFDPRPQQIAALQAERTKVKAEFGARVTEIERQISELTCLEMS